MPVKIEDLMLAASQAIQFRMARRDFDYKPYYFVTRYDQKRSANAAVKLLRNNGFPARVLEVNVGHQDGEPKRSDMTAYFLYVATPARKRKRKKYLLPSERNKR
jgi:hypothetical protein